MTLKSKSGVTQGHCKWHHSIDQILLAFHSNYGSILYHFRDRAGNWDRAELKIGIFSYPTCILCPH